MRKPISALPAAALLLICLCGCGGESPATEAPTETTAPTEYVERIEPELPADERPYVGVELNMLSLLDASDARAAVLAQAAQAFEIRTGAQVLVEYFGGDADALMQRIADADIFNVAVDDLAGTMAAQALDLTDMAAKADYEARSHAALRDQIIERCGFLAGIAQEPLLYGMYYHVDAFSDAGIEDPPHGWEDHLMASEGLVRAGYMPFAMDIETSHLVLELHLERQIGAQELQNRMENALWTQQIEYFDLFRRAIDYAGAGYLAKGDPAAFPNGQDKLALSNVAMAAGSNELCAQVERSTGMELNWGVFPYPGDGDGRGFAVESNVLCISKTSQHAQAAFDFLMLLTTGEFDRLYADVGIGIPADPQNVSRIVGATQLLADADTQGIGILHEKDNELFSRLWNGWYKTPKYFASAMNGLSRDYQSVSGAGVG